MNRDRLAGRVTPLLTLLYPDAHDAVRDRVLTLAERWASPLAERARSRPVRPLDRASAFLITYGDSLRHPGEVPLRTLARVLDDVVGDVLTDVHLLPIYPWTSDDGFAVVDHREVDPALGTWQDVAAVAARHGLMLDLVANHVSSASPWFTDWLAGVPARAGFFLSPGPDFDTSRVVRPRTSPLLHTYQRPDGGRATAWTTFGPDQVDVDVRTPAVLLELTDVLLGYLARGASTVRLDAIGFLWKESGTTCLHLPQTHAVVKLWRALVDELLPGARLITETNVPHAENITYFGCGADEATMVYQFALPPLVLHAFVTGDTRVLTRWAAGIRPVSRTATWFNFLASHDGIGLRPTEGLLTDADRDRLVRRALDRGGRVSLATGPDGAERVYELNVGYLEALAPPGETDPVAVARRGLAAHAILLSLVGVPALYYHSLFGSSHDPAAAATGIDRRINRAPLDADDLVPALASQPRRRTVFLGLRRLLEARRQHPAFSPFADQAVEDADRRVLLVRRAPGTAEEVACAVNVSDEPVRLPTVRGTDLLSGTRYDPLYLPPFGYAWVKPG